MGLKMTNHQSQAYSYKPEVAQRSSNLFKLVTAMYERRGCKKCKTSHIWPSVLFKLHVSGECLLQEVHVVFDPGDQHCSVNSALQKLQKVTMLWMEAYVSTSFKI